MEKIRTMKSVAIISSISIHNGSPIRYWNICKGLSELGHKVSYMEPCPPGSRRRDTGTVDYIPLNIWTSSNAWIITAFFQILRVMASRRFDAVMVMKPMPHAVLPALIWRLITRRRIILDIDDYEWFFFGKNRLFLAAMDAYEALAAKCFDFINVHNSNLLQRVIGYGCKPEKVLRLDQGLDITQYASASPATGLLRDLGWEGKTVLVYSAFLGPAAALDALLRPLETILKSNENIRLLIIGGGSRLKAYQDMVSGMGLAEKVHFTGNVGHDAALSLIRSASVALNYLNDEDAQKYRSQIKIREYLLLGIPVISSAGGDNSLFSQYAAIAKTPEEFAAQLQKVLANYADAKAKALAGRTFVEKNFDIRTLLLNWAKAALD